MNDNSYKVVEADINEILPNRFQPRIQFDEEEILELSDSIKEHGVIQPIVVRTIGDKYEIIAGERRYKASVLAGKETVPVIIKNLNDKDSAEVALIENIQRKNLTPIEEALSYKKILDMGYLTQENLAAKIGKSQSSVANKIRLLNLSDEVQEALLDNKISERHARSLLRLKSINEQNTMLDRIVKERLTVRKTDEEIEKMLNNSSADETLDGEEKIIEKGDILMNNEVNQVKETIAQPDNTFDIFGTVPSNTSMPTMEPVAPVMPSMPAMEPVTPVMPSMSTMEPVTPVMPSMPTMEPVTPVMPSMPTMEPVTPKVPSMPTMEPVTPVMPSMPIMEPVVPELPSMPTMEPATPEVPSMPAMEPATPEVPSMPAMEPVIPEVPSMPTMEPVTPVMPSMPTVPEMSPIVDKSAVVAPVNNIEEPVTTAEVVQEPTPVESNTTINEIVKPEPIIVTDYNKQYDPVMPYANVQPQTKVDFKEIINAIRECSEKIEKYGYKIDVEEYDLSTIYQVVFKVEK